MKQFTWQKMLLWVTVFSIAMGLLECVVVIYLRAIYYPSGFKFPLTPMDPKLVLTEISREAATIVMLMGIGAIAGKNFLQRFGFFIISFAIWDIFYYVFLKLFLGWPESLFTWDILFLIPIIWTSPVIYPIIVSLSMLLLGIIMIAGTDKENKKKMDWKIWVLLIFGSFILIVTFMLDFIHFLHKSMSFMQFLTNASNNTLLEISGNYLPGSFNWLAFWTGELVILTGVFLTVLKLRNAGNR
jgi:hypothetical protein